MGIKNKEQVPKGWEYYNLEDICKSVSERTNYLNEDEVYFINTSDIYDGRLLNKKLTKSKFLPGQAKKTFLKNDILFSEIRPINKRFMLVNFDSKKYIASTKLLVLRSNEKIDSHFLYQNITSKNCIKNFQQIAVLRSGSFPQITFDAIRKTKLLIPPISEQKAIVNVLSSLDNKIEHLIEQNKLLKELGQIIFKNMFGKYNINDKLPKGWSISKLGESKDASFIPSGINNFDNQKKYFATADVSENYIVGSGEVITYYKRPSRANMEISDYSVWFSKMSGEKKVLFFDKKKEYILSTGFTGLQSNKIFFPYLTFFILDKKFIDKKNKMGDNKAVQPAVNNKDISSFNIIIPNREYLDKFSKITYPMLTKILHNNKQIKILEEMRDTLLPGLMGGKIRIRYE